MQCDSEFSYKISWFQCCGLSRTWNDTSEKFLFNLIVTLDVKSPSPYFQSHLLQSALYLIYILTRLCNKRLIEELGCQIFGMYGIIKTLLPPAVLTLCFQKHSLVSQLHTKFLTVSNSTLLLTSEGVTVKVTEVFLFLKHLYYFPVTFPVMSPSSLHLL